MYCESSSTTTTRRADTKASDSARHGGQRPRQDQDLSGALIGSLVCYTSTRELLDRVDAMRFTQQGFLPLPLGNVREHPPRRVVSRTRAVARDSPGRLHRPLRGMRVLEALRLKGGQNTVQLESAAHGSIGWYLAGCSTSSPYSSGVCLAASGLGVTSPLRTSFSATSSTSNRELVGCCTAAPPPVMWSPKDCHYPLRSARTQLSKHPHGASVTRSPWLSKMTAGRRRRSSP